MPHIGHAVRRPQHPPEPMTTLYYTRNRKFVQAPAHPGAEAARKAKLYHRFRIFCLFCTNFIFSHGVSRGTLKTGAAQGGAGNGGFPYEAIPCPKYLPSEEAKRPDTGAAGGSAGRDLRRRVQMGAGRGHAGLRPDGGAGQPVFRVAGRAGGLRAAAKLRRSAGPAAPPFAAGETLRGGRVRGGGGPAPLSQRFPRRVPLRHPVRAGGAGAEPAGLASPGPGSDGALPSPAIPEYRPRRQRYFHSVPYRPVLPQARRGGSGAGDSEKDQHLRRSQRHDRPDLEQWPSSPPGSGVLSDRRDGRSDQSVGTADDGLCLLLSTKGR